MPAALTKQRVRYCNTSSLAAPYISVKNKAASAYKKRENICPILTVGLIKTYTVKRVGETC